MIYSDWNDGTEINNKTRLILDLNGKLGMLKAVDNTPHYWCQQIGIYPSQFPLMQYTGLKDKNGKEIYEGDILHVFLMDSPPEKHQVIWDKERAGFKLQDRIAERYGFYASNLKCEVIGNIYENPELLEVNHAEPT